MSVACASRFAVLKLEDEEPTTTAPKLEKSRNVANPQECKQSNESKTKKKKKKNSQDSELQNLAFGVTKTPKSKSANQSKQNQAQSSSGNQWEEWKKQDAKYVSDAYEQDLQQAILLSKIDFEEKKDFYNSVQKETETSKSSSSNQKKKNKANQKKDKTMTLKDFQNSSSESNSSAANANAIQDKNPPNSDESKFFDKIEEDAEEIIHKEYRKDAYQRIEAYRDDHVRNIQYQDELEKKDQEIAKLTEEVDRLKLEMKAVKERNKKMLKVLLEAEMHEKAEIIIKVEQITKVKDELTEQVSLLHTALEQERSKVHALTTELKKFQNKKKDTKQ
ncbi:G kinase-anchoring protein 1-like [Centruroides vittatus]|uniref:G kinase-anchoring protein 1-like n=1 Tax=Centruroides vittatus TaxID=120091 RepID=UPI00350EF36C